MLKKTVTYTDYNGKERTEDFYFNLSQAELAEMHLSTENGLEDLIQKIINSKNNKETVEYFKKIVLMSYGQKSEDGRRFIKSEELSKEFSETPVYDELFIQLCTDEKAAAEFVNGIMPKQMVENLNAQNRAKLEEMTDHA